MSRDIVLWVPPDQLPEAIEDRERKTRLRAAKDAETEARLEIARDRQAHASMMRTGRELVLHQLQKLLRLSNDPDYQNTMGPVAMNDLIKLAELVSKDYRLSTGQATENIAHAIGPSIDFSKLSQEERDRWRELAMKGGAEE